MDNPLDSIPVVIDDFVRSKFIIILKETKFKYELKTVSQNIIQYLDRNSALTDDVANMLSDEAFKKLISRVIENNGFDLKVELKKGFHSLTKQYELPDELRSTCFRMLWQSIANYLKMHHPDFYHRFQTDVIAAETSEIKKGISENLSISKNTQSYVEEILNILKNDHNKYAIKGISESEELHLSSTKTTTNKNLHDDGMYFSLRSKYINEILDLMSNSSHPGMVIWGEGGLGKTSTAIWLANHFSDSKEYQKVIWVEYNGSLDDSLLGILNVVDQFRKNREEQLLLLKECLQSINMPKTLIILDDVSASEFESPSGVISLQMLRKCKKIDVIVTTRTVEGTCGKESKSKNDYTWKRIPPLNEEQAVSLFKHYYSQAFEPNKDDEDAMRYIVNHVFYNPLCIELIAKAATQTLIDDDITLSDFGSKIISKDETNYLPVSFPDIMVETDYSKDECVLSRILRNVYGLSKLSYSDQMILWSFAILPNIYIKISDIKIIIGCSIDDVKKLFARGWLKFLPGKGFQMHDIVKAMIWIDHNDNPFLSGIMPTDYETYTYSYTHNKYGFAPEGVFSNVLLNVERKEFFSENDTYESEALKIQLLKACRDRIKIPDNKIVNFLSVLARHTFFGLGNKTESEEFFKEAINYVNRYSTKDVMEVYYYYAYLLSSMDTSRFSEAVDLMETARVHMLDWQVTGRDFAPLPDDASPDEQICEIIYNESFDALEKAISESTKIHQEKQFICYFSTAFDFRTYAKILDHLGYILTIIESDNCLLAEIYLTVALRIREILIEIAIISYNLRKENNHQPQSLETQIESLAQDYIAGQGQEIDKRISKILLNNYVINEDFRKHLVSWDVYDIIHGIQAVATTKDNLGYLLSHGNKDHWEQARKLLIEALELRRKLEKIETGKHGSELSWTLCNLAEIEVKMGGKENLKSAESLYLESINIRKELCNKTYGKYRDNLAWSYIGLARCYELMKNIGGMNKYLDLALNIYEELAKENVDFANDAMIVKNMIEKQSVVLIIGNQTHLRLDT